MLSVTAFADSVGFEPTVESCLPTPLFESGAIIRSANCPFTDFANLCQHFVYRCF